jgi:hypothetical protein
MVYYNILHYITQYQNLEGHEMHLHCHENLKSCTYVLTSHLLDYSKFTYFWNWDPLIYIVLFLHACILYHETCLQFYEKTPPILNYQLP